MRVIDIHTHGIGGFDTRASSAEAVLSMAEIMGREGVSAILASIYPAGKEKMRADMEAVKAAMEMQKAGQGTAESPPAAGILGVHLEGPFLNPRYAGALDASSFREPRIDLYQEIAEGFEGIIKSVTLSPELPGAPVLTRTLADKGVAVSMGHSGATHREAEDCFDSGARGITHLFNAMTGFHHREPGLAGFGLLNHHVYVELIADPFHLHKAALELVFRIKDPGKIIIVSDAVKETPGIRGQADRGPVTDREGRLQGGAMTVTEAAERLINLGFDKEKVLNAITENPRAFLAG